MRKREARNIIAQEVAAERPAHRERSVAKRRARQPDSASGSGRPGRRRSEDPSQFHDADGRACCSPASCWFCCGGWACAWRRNGPSGKPSRARARFKRRWKPKWKSLFNSLADLDELFANGKIAREALLERAPGIESAPGGDAEESSARAARVLCHPTHPALNPRWNCAMFPNISGAFRRWIGVCLRVEPGDSILLYGPNGAGKTTLLRVLSTLARPSEGKVLYDGADVLATLPPRKPPSDSSPTRRFFMAN